MSQEFTLTHDSFGRLVFIAADDTRYTDVEPVRAFPNSAREEWISLVNAEGHELAFVERLSDLPEATRTLLEAEFATREFLPTIEQIRHISAMSEPCEWTVETDRGPTSFVLSAEEHVRRLDDHRALITDASGVRYQVANLQTLDPRSRRYLERYL